MLLKLLSILSFVFIASFLLSWGLAEIITRYGSKFNLMDIPNKRSLHKTPTPRAGGLAFIISFLLGSGLLYCFGLIPLPLLKAFWIGGIPITLIGLIDDLGHIRASFRLLTHIALAVWVLYLFEGLPILDLGFYQIEWHWMGWIVGILGLVWLINIYNFMDGTDGLSGSQAIFVSLATVLLLLLNNTPDFIPALLLLAFCVLGFLIKNWPPAKLFMGDCGSGFLGYIFGVFLIATVTHNTLSPWQWLILFGVFWVDATLTLVRRMLNGKKWYQPHSDHAFRHAVDWLGPHTVLLGIMAINLLWLLSFALLSVRYAKWEVVLTLIAVLPLVAVGIRLKAGVPYQG